MVKFNGIFLTAFIVILSAALFIWMTSDTGADIQSTASNATISEYVAIGLSGNLSLSGIAFGSVNPNTNNNNASGNNNSDGQNSSYNVNVSTDSNVAVDFCIRDNYALNNSGNTPIANSNYHWADVNNSLANSSDPRMPGTDMLTTYQKTNNTNVQPGGLGYFRFWLNVPTAQAAAVYSNTVFFEGVKTGNAC